jgi:hypothetical protein
LLFSMTSLSLLRTVVVPRNLRSLITDLVINGVVGASRLIAKVSRTYMRRDAALAWAGPLIIIALLITWLMCYIFAYGFLIYGISGQPLGASIVQSGSSLLTLGFAYDNGSSNATLLDFFAAITGPVVIALMIGYLPALYQTFIDREVPVTLMATDAGEPAWGPELLSRMSLAKSISDLPMHLGKWASWAAKLRMTHITYPMLMYVRSGRGTRHFLVSLLTAMDASALMIALNTSLPRTPAYVTLLHGSESIQTLYIFFGAKRSKLYYLPLRSLWAHKVTSGSQVRAEQVKVPARDAEIAAVHEAAAADASNALAETGYRSFIRAEKMTTTLTRAEFDYAIEILRGSDFPIEVEIEDAWEMFRRIRATYEFPMYALLRRLDATPAPWTGPRNTPTPVMWPTLASDLHEQGKRASAKSPDESSNPPAPDAPNP